MGSGIAAFGTGLAADAGITGAVGTALGAGLEGAAFGAGTGAIEGLVTDHGKNFWKDVGTGALTGGAIGGLGPELGAVTGLGTTAGDTLAGAGAGALGAGLTHQNILTGALEGGVAGFGSGLLSGGPTAPGQLPPTGGAPGGAGGPLAGGSVAPPGVTAGAPDVGGVPSAISGDLGAITQPALPTLDSAGGAAGDLSAVGTNLPTTGAAGGASTGGSALNTTGLGDLNPQTGIDLGAGSTQPSLFAPDNTGSVVGGAPAGGPSGPGGFLKNLAPLIPAAGMLLDASRTQKKPYNFSNLEASAGSLATQGAEMRSYIESGTLPPGQQAGLTAATDAASASITSGFAARGDLGSSAAAQDQQNLQLKAQAQAAQEAQALFNSGLNETNQANQLYTELMQVQLSQDAEMSQAFGTFASALAGMGRPVAAALGG